MRNALGLVLLLAGSASAQSFAPGAAVYPSPPLGRHFLDSAVATCVIATPVSANAVMLTPCPPGAGPPPQAAQLPAPAAPPVVAEPKSEPKKEPQEIVIRVEVVPVAPGAPKAPALKVAPKKSCPCP